MAAHNHHLFPAQPPFHRGDLVRCVYVPEEVVIVRSTFRHASHWWLTTETLWGVTDCAAHLADDFELAARCPR